MQHLSRRSGHPRISQWTSTTQNGNCRPQVSIYDASETSGTSEAVDYNHSVIYQASNKNRPARLRRAQGGAYQASSSSLITEPRRYTPRSRRERNNSDSKRMYFGCTAAKSDKAVYGQASRESKRERKKKVGGPACETQSGRHWRPTRRARHFPAQSDCTTLTVLQC